MRGKPLPRLLAVGAGLALIVAAVMACTGRLGPARGEVRQMVYLTPLVKIDKLYPSMFGPSNVNFELRLTQEQGPAELLWITGYRADMVGPDGEDPRPQDLMCHNSLNFHSMSDHRRMLGSGFYGTPRLFTLAQGQSRLDLPEGFGLPISSAERLLLGSQLVNMRQDLIGSEARHRVRATYVSDRDAGPMQALSLLILGVEVQMLDEQAEAMPTDRLSCAADAGGQKTFVRHGKEFTSHWFVKPGEETRRTRLRGKFPFDTTIHYISTHLHTYGQSLEMRDLTAGKSLFTAHARPTADGLGIKAVDQYSSVEGMPVYRDHEYELISHYHNPTNQDVTAMAYMFCYIKDPTFQRPHPKALADWSEELCESPPGK